MAQNKKEPMNNNRIKEVRLAQHKTQKDLAKFLGVSEQAIAYYEKALREPPLKSWIKLADYLGVSVSYLQGLSKIKDPNFFDDVDKMSHFITQESINRYKHGFTNPSPDNALLSWSKENNIRAFNNAFKIFINRHYCDGDQIRSYEAMAANLNDDRDMGAIAEIASDIFRLSLKAYSGDKRAKAYYDKIYKILYEGYFEIDPNEP